MNLYLVGARGSGKTTVGRQAAARLGLAFVDADAEVERDAGRTVAELFAAEGEPGFRARERRAMLALARRDGLVVATGGGAVLEPDVRAALKATGVVVWLDAPPEVRDARTAGSDRPPLTGHGRGAAEERAVAAAREPLYRDCAAARVATEGRTPEEVADDVERVWRAAARDDVR
ncbi:MAG: shikimate kinase [Deltaproteobacteria bacterium]|nr:shikimate kinase [Deltaproteobacteria bacterium]